MDARAWWSVAGRWAAGMAVVAGGCGEQESGRGQGGTSVVGEGGIVLFTPPDAGEVRETWRDAPSGIAFTAVGAGWRRMEAAELAGIGPDVRIGVERRGCRGWASMKRGHEGGPRAVADEARGALGLEEAAVHVDEDVKYDMWTARRWEVQGKRAGGTVSVRATFFVDLGRLYRVQGEASDSSYGDRRRCLDQVTAGFAFGLPSER